MATLPQEQRPGPTLTTPAGRAPWFSTERIQGFVLALALFALELFPLYTWLLIAAGIGAGAIDDVPVPFTYLVVAGAAFALLAHAQRNQPLSATLTQAIPLAFIALLVAVRISPGAYGNLPGGPLDMTWITVLSQDLQNASDRVEALVFLLFLVLGIGWRGVVIGHSFPPEFDDVLDRFKVATAAMVVAAVATAAVSPAVRAQMAGPLTLFLPLTVFCGMIAAALSRTALHREELAGTDPRAAGGSRWLAMAIVLSGVVVLSTLVLGAILNYGSVTAALTSSGPVGGALDAALTWLANGVAWLLYEVVSGIYALGSLLFGSISRTPIQQNNQPPFTGKPPAATPISHTEISVLTVVVLVVLLLIGIYWLRRLFSVRRDATPEAIVEERESLNGRSLFLAQLRGLFDRSPREPKEVEENLPGGGIRALYREVLRAAARRGLARQPSETADEFGARLARGFAGAVEREDVARLSDAYDSARYGERDEPSGLRRELQERAKRVLATLRKERSG